MSREVTPLITPNIADSPPRSKESSVASKAAADSQDSQDEEKKHGSFNIIFNTWNAMAGTALTLIPFDF